MKNALRAALLTLAALVYTATPAVAGNIALTGHDSDFHCPSGNLAYFSGACDQINEMVAFARAGASDPTLPVLTFDQGTQLTTDLTGLGVSFVNINTVAGVETAAFDPTLYSAFAVASHTSCGGCDNSSEFVDAIAARLADITTFFNAGGGIVGMTGGHTYATQYYSFVPETAGGLLSSPPSSGYVSTNPPCFGTPITAVNGDATHNFFPEPGTGGVSSLYCVAERLGSTGQPMTLLLEGGRIETGVIVTTVITTTAGAPEPVALALLGIGMAGAALRRRRLRSAAAE